MRETNIYPIIGMSPGNSYFQEETVSFLLERVVSKFGKTAVLIPDVPAIATYKTLGYSENRARRDKAIPKGNALRNKVRRAMEVFDYDDSHVKVFDWVQDIETKELYAGKYKMIVVLYKNNKSFQKAIRLATKEVILASGKESIDFEPAIDIAVHYILSEFACLEFLVEHLEVPKIIYIYHKRWPVYEEYIAGGFDQVPKLHLDFLQIKKEP